MIWTWTVGFCSGEAWTTRWLKRGYGHCWAARPLWDDLWLWVEWTPGRIVVGPVGAEMVERARRRATLVLEVDTVPGQRVHSRPWPVLGWWHCVRLVVDVMGVRIPWWPTPYGFARALLAAEGARNRVDHENPKGAWTLCGGDRNAEASAGAAASPKG